jgi:chromosome segregation ATPase
MEVETVVAVSLMMAVFSAIAAIGTSVVLGAGFERLRSGFEVIRKQTGFFSDAIHQLEQKVEIVDEQASAFTQSIHQMEAKVNGVGEQANAFTSTVQKLEKKVEVVDKQTGFFSQAIQKLDKKIDTVSAHEEIVSEKMEAAAGNDLISTGKAEALVSHAEDLLSQMSTLALKMNEPKAPQDQANQGLSISIPRNLSHSVPQGQMHAQAEESVVFH